MDRQTDRQTDREFWSKRILQQKNKQIHIILNSFQDLISGRMQDLPLPNDTQPFGRQSGGHFMLSRYFSSRNDAKYGNFFSRFTLHTSLGFTLSEILITLAIIGIVAALTIPALMVNYQKTQTISQLKEAYSLLNQAAELIKEDNGGTFIGIFAHNALLYGASHNLDIWAKYLKHSRICYGAPDTYINCWATTYNLTGTTLTDWSNAYVNYSSGMVLANGMTVLLAGDTGDGWGPALGSGLFGNTCAGGTGQTNNECSGVIIDLNGRKPPNRAGKDVFIFVLTIDGLKPYHDTWTDCDDTGGSGVRFYGTSCAYRIVQDNWQINY